MSTFSITEIRNALRCPRLFALGKLTGRPVDFPVGASVLGAVFHRIVAALGRTASEPPADFAGLPAHAPPAETAAALARWLLQLLVRELELAPACASMPAELDDLAEALRRFAAHVAARLQEHPGRPALALPDLVAGADLAIDGVVNLGAGVEVRLTGRIDALHAPADKTVEIVEYKLGPDGSTALDRAQVAFHRHLIRRARDLDATPVLLRFEPAPVETRLRPAESDALVQGTLLPLLAAMRHWAQSPETAPAPATAALCPSCPSRTACVATYPAALPARDDPPAPATHPRPDASGELVVPELGTSSGQEDQDDEDAAGLEEGASICRRIEELLRRQEVPRPVAKARVAARVVRVEVSVGRRRAGRVDRAADAVLHRIHAEDERDATYARSGGRRTFTVARRQPRAVRLLPLLAEHADWLRERAGRFIVGEAVEGGAVAGDLSDPAACHVLAGGAAGSGKSVLLRALAASLAHFHGPDAIRFTLVDTGGGTFAPPAAGLAAHLEHPLCRDADDGLAVLEGLVDEMEERYHLFERASAQDIDEYNERPVDAERLARHVVMVDEIEDLATTEETRETLVGVVQRLGAKARAAGLHLVLASGHAGKDGVVATIAAGLPGQIALRTATAAESRVLIDQPGAERLFGPGDLLANLGQGLQRGQAALH